MYDGMVWHRRLSHEYCVYCISNISSAKQRECPSPPMYFRKMICAEL